LSKIVSKIHFTP